MDDVPVVIVGGGPSGLTLGIALARCQVRSLVLEKEIEITQDPRGVYLNGDAVRILWDLGIREQFKEIGCGADLINFHKTNVKNKPFYAFDFGGDVLQQAVPTGIFHQQPRLEAALEQQALSSGYCTIKRGCAAESQQLTDHGLIIGYRDQAGKSQKIKSRWLVGADGKKGIVRKHFLEESAGIKQVDGVYKYSGTWIAANMKVNLPTLETHPNLPFWKAGLTAERAYELYWPSGWHFCSPPGKPVVCGAFGPPQERLWRFEFAEPNWSDTMDSKKLLWEQMIPAITRDRDDTGKRFAGGPVQWPRDCIDLRRCRPFTFIHKVVNKWFDRGRLLIGDAAHVFPPFGGQGIATGVRDAHQLAWRLALIEQTPRITKSTIECLLTAWATERRRNVDDVTIDTARNAMLCNEPEPWFFYFFRHIEPLLQCIPFFPKPSEAMAAVEAKGFKGLQGGSFCVELGGGGKLAQVFVQAADGHIRRSDEVLKHATSAMTLLVFDNTDGSRIKEALAAIRKTQMPRSLVAEESVVAVQSQEFWETENYGLPSDRVIRPIQADHKMGMVMPRDYSADAYRNRLGHLTRFALVRPDFYIFALARDFGELENALYSARGMLENS